MDCPSLLLSGSTSRSALQRQIDALLTDKALQGARIGCRVIDGASGKVLYSFHAADPLIPASNMKLATTAAALDALGADWRFVTRVGLSGKDLVVIGAGDPNISGRFFDGRTVAVLEAWARDLRERGITAIEGDLVGDDTLFDREYRHPTWPREQLSSWYCAPVGALSLNDNCLDVTVRPGPRAGQPLLVDLQPAGDHHALVLRALTAEAGQRPAIDVYRREGSAAVVVTGRIPLGGAAVGREVTVDDPGQFFIRSFRAVLGRQGITVKGTCRLADAPTDPKALKVLTSYTSTLAQTVQVTNTRSQNFYAESLLKLVGARAAGPPGTFAKGSAAVEAFLAGGAGDCRASDGSGLSRDNRLSAMHLTGLLRHMASRPEGALFRQSLATSGVDGGLRQRLAEAPFRGRVHAKTGTLSGVSALTGYVDTLDGRSLIFSVIVNGHRCPADKVRAIQDGLCRALVTSQP